MKSTHSIYDLDKIKTHLAKALDSKRYEHTLGVAYTAAALAMCHQADMEGALVAGLLHDCAKCMENEKKIHICEKYGEKYGIEITPVERRNPYLLHAKAGSILAAEKYHITHPDILYAVRSHTTGRPGMRPLEIIVFLADYLEPGRGNTPPLEKLRRLAFHDLDQALLIALEDTLISLRDSGKEVDPMTRQTYDYYKMTLE